MTHTIDGDTVWIEATLPEGVDPDETLLAHGGDLVVESDRIGYRRPGADDETLLVAAWSLAGQIDRVWERLG